MSSQTQAHAHAHVHTTLSPSTIISVACSLFTACSHLPCTTRGCVDGSLLLLSLSLVLALSPSLLPIMVLMVLLMLLLLLLLPLLQSKIAPIIDGYLQVLINDNV